MSSSNSASTSSLYRLDVYALSSLIKDQFEHLDAYTSTARCVITCLVYTCVESTHRCKGSLSSLPLMVTDLNSSNLAKCQLSYYMRDLQGNMTIPHFHDVIIQDEMVLGPGDMYELLMSPRIHDHLVEFGLS
ncbi:hypothetical protein DFH28DRAFT_936123 [Melampsora americana]|nr:hypothetical protein DFH28DRAFT_936123 [Melampsora americana]